MQRRPRLAVWSVCVVLCLGLFPDPSPWAEGMQRDPATELDRVFDLYIRDGLVYYSALRAERVVIDRFLASIRDVPPGFGSWDPDSRKAFWLNAYNAIVLETILDQYPIRGSSPEYPSNSVRQIAGAFDSEEHQVAGRRVTLDAIETDILSELGDPRVFLALGRGAVDGGRLRSEIYRATCVDEQLTQIVREFATTPRYFDLDRFGQRLRVSAIFGWREPEFVAALADQGWLDSGRTALERAILNLIEPELFPVEQAFLRENNFMLSFHEFDWRLNDLTGGRPSNRE